MSAVPQSQPPEPQTLRLFDPAASSPESFSTSISPAVQSVESVLENQHRLSEPVLVSAIPPQNRGAEPTDQELYEAWNSQALAATRYKPKLVPAELRAEYAAKTSLPAFYRDCVSGRWEVVRRDVKDATHQKDRQQLNRWAWGTRPATWPEGRAWEGPSLAVIEASNEVLLDEFIQRLEVSSPEDPDKPLSAATIHTTWGPLRTILKHAVSMRAISRFPDPSGLPEKEVEARPYTADEIERLWSLLSGQPLQQIALVVSINCGLRPIDLFTLPRDALVQDAIGRWTLKFKARKTSKKHWLPLADVTLRALRRAAEIADRGTLPTMESGWFFPGLSNPSAAEPEDSYAARNRAKITRVIWDAAGLYDVERPWQSGRSTCASRLSALNRDAGKFLLGTSSPDVFTTHYAPARPDFWTAVQSVPQPQCFLRAFGSP